MTHIFHRRRSGRLLGALLLALALVACGSDTVERTPLLTLDPVSPITTERSKILSGTVEAGANVEVATDTAAGVQQLTVAGGRWSCVVEGLTPGNNPVWVSAADSAGNSTVLQVTFVYEIVTLETYITPTPLAEQTVGGLVAPGASPPVVAVDSTASVGPVAVAGNLWSCAISGLADGANALSVTHTDDAGQQVSATATITVDAGAPALSIDPFPNPAESTQQIFSGTVSPSSSVEMTFNGETVADPTLETTGDPWGWSIPAVTLQRGKNTLRVNAGMPGAPTSVARTFVLFE